MGHNRAGKSCSRWVLHHIFLSPCVHLLYSWMRRITSCRALRFPPRNHCLPRCHNTRWSAKLSLLPQYRCNGIWDRKSHRNACGRPLSWRRPRNLLQSVYHADKLHHSWPRFVDRISLSTSDKSTDKSTNKWLVSFDVFYIVVECFTGSAASSGSWEIVNCKYFWTFKLSREIGAASDRKDIKPSVNIYVTVWRCTVPIV